MGSNIVLFKDNTYKDVSCKCRTTTNKIKQQIIWR